MSPALIAILAYLLLERVLLVLAARAGVLTVALRRKPATKETRPQP